jgi:hypothetical protein
MQPFLVVAPFAALATAGEITTAATERAVVIRPTVERSRMPNYSPVIIAAPSCSPVGTMAPYPS